MKTVTSYPISETPLSLILQGNVQLRSPEFTTRHAADNGIVSITLVKDTGEGAGELKLEFTKRRLSFVAGPSATRLMSQQL